MKTTCRSYQDENGDFNLLCEFFITYPHQIRKYSTWCLGRLVDWKYGLWGEKGANPDFWNQNAALWFDGFGKLAGFVVSEDGGGSVVIITAEGYRFLYTELLAWVLTHWEHRQPALRLEITAEQQLEASVLKTHGFQQVGTFYTSHFDLALPLAPQPPLEQGFSIKSMAADADYHAQHILRQNAFAGRQDIPEDEITQELALYNHSHLSPIYHAETDLCVVAPDGKFAAGCEALIDTWNLEADIERVCTHSDHRRKGLARAVILECLHRLQQMGMRRAYITGYSEAAIGLYSSLGAYKQSPAWIYELAREP